MIYGQMQMGQGKFGMQTMNQALYSLYSRKMVSLEEAMSRSADHEELQNMIAHGGDAGLPTHMQGQSAGGTRPVTKYR